MIYQALINTAIIENKLTYNGIYLCCDKTDDKKIFNRGNITIDLIDVYDFLAEYNYSIQWDDSYEKFLKFNKDFKWIRFHDENDEVFSTLKSLKYCPNYLEETTEYIIPKSAKIKTFDDLVSFYNNYNDI